MSLRLPVAFALALFVSLAIILFMQNLIATAGRQAPTVEPVTLVELYKSQEPKDQLEEPQPEPEQEIPAEPQMQALAVESPAPPAPSVAQAMPTMEMGSIDIGTALEGDPWSSSIGGEQSKKLLEEIGEDAQGFIEVVPYGTRQPSVPQLAWENKIDGWVLVAFSVNPEGYTRNIKVLDANPRGVFEATVAAAVQDWRYMIKGVEALQGDLLLTQKVEVFWKDYPMNVKGYEE